MVNPVAVFGALCLSVCFGGMVWAFLVTLADIRETVVRFEMLLETIEQNQRRGAPAIIDLTTTTNNKEK